MLALALYLLLLANGTGGGHSPGVAGADPHVVGPFQVPGGLLAGGTAFSWVAPRTGQFMALHWLQSTAGVGTSMVYAVQVNGVTACSLTTACSAASRQDQECTGGYELGDTLSVVVLTDNCLVGNPAGNLMVVLK